MNAGPVQLRRWLLGLLVLAASVHAAPPYTLEAPPFLRDAEAAATLMGTTYTYLPTDSSTALRLMLTVMQVAQVERELGELSDVQCANLFIDELRRNYAGFFVLNQERPLGLAGHEFIQFRWTGEKAGRTITGVLSCGKLGEHYYVVHFADWIVSATATFPPIRSSLKRLTPVTP